MTSVYRYLHDASQLEYIGCYYIGLLAQLNPSHQLGHKSSATRLSSVRITCSYPFSPQILAREVSELFFDKLFSLLIIQNINKCQ